MPDTNCVAEAVRKYGDMLYRICIIMLKNHADAEDAVQETFIKYMQKAPDFNNQEHQKAWLITVSTNKCRDMLRKRVRFADESEEILYNLAAKNPESSDVIESLLELPEKFRSVMTLHYVEEYKVEEIAAIIGKSPSAVKMRLQKGRNLLREIYRKEFRNNELQQT